MLFARELRRESFPVGKSDMIAVEHMEREGKHGKQVHLSILNFSGFQLYHLQNNFEYTLPL